MKHYRGYIFDMDGVMYRGDASIQDAVDTVNILKRNGNKTIFITNNSAKLPEEYRDILTNIGVENVHKEDIITSGNVAAKHLQERLEIQPDRNRVLCVSAESVKSLMREVDLEVLSLTDYRKAHYVVVGFNKSFNWELGSRAADAIVTYGAELIGTNPDHARPVENGEIEAGTGSIISFIETASRTKARIMGKPYPDMYKMAIQQMEVKVYEALMVGDMLTTDIKGAYDFGMESALVLTGMTVKEDIEKLGINPTFVIDSLKELIVE